MFGGDMSKEIKEGFVVNDRRFWVDDEERDPRDDAAPDSPPDLAPAASAAPAIDAETLRSALADLEDAKRRVTRDAEKQLERQRLQVLEALLPVLDNLERSIAAATKDGSAPALRDGVKLVFDQFLQVLGGFGLERRSALGARFDPSQHDAIAVIPVADAQQDGIVVSELEPGYVAGERVVRAARVVVGRAAERPES